MSKPDPLGFVQLLVQHAQVRGFFPESDVWRPAASKENDFAFHYLPKIDRNYSWVNIWNDMYEGKIKGLFAFGMNGVMIGPDSHKNIEALKKTDWLVVCEIYPDETSEFWRAPGITAEEMTKINTTVYRLPGAGFAEKDGTFVNSARWLQWKNAAVPPPGQARLDQDILATIFLKVRELYQKEGGKFPDPILNAALAVHESLASLALRKSRKRSTARPLPTSPIRRPTSRSRPASSLPGFAWLKDDGTTLCGNWLYCGSWTEAGAMMQRRGTEDPSGLGHLSRTGDGRGRPTGASSTTAHPATGRQAVGSRAAAGVVERRQAERGSATTCPTSKPTRTPKDHMGPFIMNPEGVGRLFVPLCGDGRMDLSRTLRTDREPDREPAASRTSPTTRS